MTIGDPSSRALGCCHGFAALARDGAVGTVETPLFPPDTDVPDFLVLRIEAGGSPRFPVVAVAAVADVDQSRRVVRLSGSSADVASLPEHLPLAL